MAKRQIALALALAGLAAGCSDQLPVSPSHAAPSAVSFDREGHEHGRGRDRDDRRRASRLANMPVTGTLSGGGTFSGLLTITGFALQNGQLVANGVLTGTATPAGGTPTQVTQMFSSIPAVLDPPPGCSILTLNLGPLNLNLLGLVVNLNQVILDLTAVPGPSNLLGNLLCAVTNLLTIPGAIAALPNLLSQVNGILGGL